MAEGGARELRLPDWPFGAVGRRLLLEALLLEEEQEMPEHGWTKTALEDMAEVGSGGIDEVLAGALQLKLIEHRNGRWLRPATRPPVAVPLLALVEATRVIPDAPIEPIPRRPYRRRSDSDAT
jgi:hypothetical protein